MKTFSTIFLRDLVASMAWHIANQSPELTADYRASHARLAAELASR